MNATEQTPEQFRWEHDSLGEIEVPKEALYGAQTQRAMTNFQITGRHAARRSARSARLESQRLINNSRISMTNA